MHSLVFTVFGIELSTVVVFGSKLREGSTLVGVFLEGTTPISWKRDYVPNIMVPPLLHRACFIGINF